MNYCYCCGDIISDGRKCTYNKNPVCIDCSIGLGAAGGRVARSKQMHRKRSSALATLNAAGWRVILIGQRFRCKICGVKFNLINRPTIDHIVPVVKGGEFTIQNIQALCLSCNRRKYVD